MNKNTYYQCDCRKLTNNDDGLCSDSCREKYFNKINSITQNHIILPDAKFAEYDTTLIEQCSLHIKFNEA